MGQETAGKRRCALVPSRVIARHGRLEPGQPDHDLLKRTHTYGINDPDSRDAAEHSAALFLSESEGKGTRDSVRDTTMNMVLRPGEALVWRWGHLVPLKYHGRIDISVDAILTKSRDSCHPPLPHPARACDDGQRQRDRSEDNLQRKKELISMTTSTLDRSRLLGRARKLSNANLINGALQGYPDPACFPITDPATRQPLGLAPKSGQEDIDKAVQGAVRAQAEWARLRPLERAQLLHRAVDRVERTSTS